MASSRADGVACYAIHPNNEEDNHECDGHRETKEDNGNEGGDDWCSTLRHWIPGAAAAAKTEIVVSHGDRRRYCPWCSRWRGLRQY